MRNRDDIKFKMDSKGEVNVEYYLNRGHQLRAEYLSGTSADVKSWFAERLNLNWLKGSFARLAHH